jgi:hypothetical protein
MTGILCLRVIGRPEGKEVRKRIVKKGGGGGAILGDMFINKPKLYMPIQLNYRGRTFF